MIWLYNSILPRLSSLKLLDKGIVKYFYILYMILIICYNIVTLYEIMIPEITFSPGDGFYAGFFTLNGQLVLQTYLKAKPHSSE